MTEQPVETEQQFLGNASIPGPTLTDSQQAVLNRALQSYKPNAHRLPYKPFNIAADVPAVEATFLERTKQADLWLDAEEQATRALAEIQDGNINAGIACLQASLAFAQNYRHSLTEEVAR